MMTYLKHACGKKHSDLKTKTFEEIQVLYERLKRQDQNFVAIGSAKDERQIKELNKDLKKKRVIKETPREEDTAKVHTEQEVTEQGFVSLYELRDDCQYSEITPEDIELILWGDLKIMMESSTKENDQGLEVEEESTDALQLVRFIKLQLNEE
ncbi:hypothetical protein Tco_0836942 [Tanacetum coccineum]